MPHVSPGFSAWFTVEGSHDELQHMVDNIETWTASIDGRSTNVVSWDGDSRLHMLGGALLELASQGLFQPVPPPMVDAARLDLLLRRLASVLRPHQLEAARAALLAPWGWSLLSIPMGGGKSVLSAALVALGAALDWPQWLYVVTNKELVAQTRAVFDRLMPKLQGALDDEWREPEMSFTSYGSVEESLWHGLILDEVHGLAAKGRREAYLKLGARAFRIGMSGTALDRSDGRNALTISLVGPVAYNTDVKGLEVEGSLAKGRISQLVFDRVRGRLIR